MPHALFPPGPVFALVVVPVAGSAALAVLGFIGGYLGPVLISTGSANHVGLLLVGIGYVAPSPPRLAGEGERA